MMSEPAINRRTLGVTFSADQQAHVVVWVPQAREVALSIKDHSLLLPLTKDSSGYWQLTTDQLKPGDTYTFILDSEKEWADPASLWQPDGIYGSSQAVNTSCVYWEDSSWVNPPIDEYIMYEINIHTFTKEGTLKAIIHKLNHIKRLGVSAILIRPINDFPDSPTQHAAFLFAVQASYGGPGQLQQFVNACHFEGLAVMLDVSYRQIDQAGHVLNELNGQATRKQSVHQPKTEINPEAAREAYRHYLTENALMWFRDFHVDALRLENVYSLPDADLLLHEIREYTNALTLQTGRQYYLLVEQELTHVSGGLKEMGGFKNTDSNQLADCNCTRYYMDFSHNRHQTKQYRQDCLCDSTFSRILQEQFDRETEIVSNQALVTALQIHQQAYGSEDQQVDAELIKLVAGSIMVSPCIPTLFMGEEWGVSNPFQRLVHHESGTAGSDLESLLIDHESQAESVLPWEMLNELPNQTLYKYYQALTALRRQQPALYHLNPNQAAVIYQDGDPTLVLHRSYKTNQVLCLMNFSRERQMITLPSLGQNWQQLLDSADPIWAGPGASPELLPDASTVHLQPQSIVVYKASTCPD